MNKQLLETRLSIIMVRENKTFLTTFTEFRSLLIKYFKTEYTLDEIETALYKMEEAYLCNELEENQRIANIASEELEEDNFNN